MEAAVYVPSPAVLEPDLHLPGPQLELDSQGLLLLLQGKKSRIFLPTIICIAMSGSELHWSSNTLLLVKPTVAAVRSNCFYLAS